MTLGGIILIVFVVAQFPVLTRLREHSNKIREHSQRINKIEELPKNPAEKK